MDWAFSSLPSSSIISIGSCSFEKSLPILITTPFFLIPYSFFLLSFRFIVWITTIEKGKNGMGYHLHRYGNRGVLLEGMNGFADSREA